MCVEQQQQQHQQCKSECLEKMRGFEVGFGSSLINRVGRIQAAAVAAFC